MVRTPKFRRREAIAAAGTLLAAGCLGAGRRGPGDGDRGYLGADPTPPERDGDWRMYGRDPGRTRHVPDADLPRDGVDVAWERSVSADGWLPPVVANGTVYCQYTNGLFVLDVESGDGKEVRTYGGFGRGAGPMAFASTTLYRDGALLVPYGRAVAGYAAAPDGWPDEVSGRGKRRARWWFDGDRADSRPPGGHSPPSWSATPVVHDGAVITLHPRGIVAAVSPDDGTPRWRYAFADADRDDLRSFDPFEYVVDPASATVVVYGRVGWTPTLVGLDLTTGSLEWLDAANGSPEAESTDHGVPELRLEEYDRLAAADRSVYVTDWTDWSPLRLREVNAASGDDSWSRSLERESHVGLAVDGTTVYHLGTVETDDRGERAAVAAVDREDGTVRWEVVLDDDPGGGVWATNQPSPTVAGDQLLVPAGKGLHALERTSGERLWTFTETVPTAGGSEDERAGITPAVVSNDRIVLGATLRLYGLE
ncbi:outer membrane protein assembly factor BamB family protein [Halopiger xanaduensis]|uniref:Pyrrolo-quinoline quinone repeat domain-containing protein n=1 Tax=Halopiger xanaduensis (strain DSM 18323 / JCM 14033 / SH-6) TaxID=797210 RepID=F8DBQ9_HALXS|nr:PQQ-binding-like beta-propeller repeat protein [Halopiger xanaduensis]AEH38330.1 hypothetical protein Halxa_3723 [Halopiger xanaduensis SH-6]